MKIDKSQIGGIRFMFTLTFFLQSSSVLTAFLNAVLEQEAWIGVILGIIICIPLVWFYRTFMLTFPDKNLIQVCQDAYGKVGGKIVGLLFVWFFLTLSALNVADLGHFTHLSVMHKTPIIVLILSCILVSVWAIRYGLKVVTRYSAVFVILQLIVMTIFFILISNQVNIKNFLPVFDQPFIKYVQGAHLSSTIPFGELVIFLMITPNLRLDKKKLTKYWFIGVGIGMLAVLGILMRDVSILGNTISLFSLPGLVTIRLISMGEAVSRIEILLTLTMVILLFFKVTLLCYVTTIALAYIFEAKSFKHLALVTGVLIVAYIPIYSKTEMENIEFARRFGPFLWTLFEYILPITTFVIAKIRTKPKEGAMQKSIAQEV